MSDNKMFKQSGIRSFVRSIYIFFLKRARASKNNITFLKGSDISKSSVIGKNCIVGGKVLTSSLEGNNSILGDVINSHFGYGSLLSPGSSIEFANVGRFCSIGRDVHIVMGQHPVDRFVSTSSCFYAPESYTGFSYARQQLFEDYKWLDKENKIAVEIGNDVWIGSHVKIMEGVKIGDGAVLAAGAVVTKDVAPYEIVGGVSAKLIRYRFNEKQREFLLRFKWWDKDPKWIEENAELFTDIDKLMEKYGNE